MTALTLSYSLTIPIDAALATTPAAPSSDTFTSPLTTDTPRAQLQSLERALEVARAWLNGGLTEWKDAMKGVEKERKAPKGEDEEDGADE